MQKAFNLEPIDGVEQTPLMYQGAADDFRGARQDIALPSVAQGIDFEGEFGVLVDDVPLGCSAEQALGHIKLVLQINDVSLRALAPREMKTGFGFLQAKPSSAFAPVAVTPDELAEAWQDGRVQLPLNIHWNEQWFGHPHGGEMNFSFGQLIAHAAFTRRLGAGTLVGSGTVSNRQRSAGSACIAERRAIEMIEQGAAQTAFMQFGDRVRMEVFDAAGQSVFGAIDQRVVQANG
ncbi:fumarylacetoacetate hydrolase [Pseudomonas sp. M47T1]|nr:fumarylacetoacetate hydrolase [Pseudomonas sp. M47T1]